MTDYFRFLHPELPAVRFWLSAANQLRVFSFICSMKKFVMTVLFAGIVAGGAFAQTSLNELGCATVTTKAEMDRLAAYLAAEGSFKTTGLNDTVPLSIHIVGNDAGAGRYSLDNLFKVICNLNSHFEPAGFYFYIKWPINYIDNSSYYEHTYWDGYQMMNQHNVTNSVNVYFVGDPNGACGYYAYGPDAVAIKNSCAGANSTTLTHELGHFFGLPHTFSGWENGNTPWNPELVTRGAFSNCNLTGDYFCDTDADYIANRWQCPYSGIKYDAKTGTSTIQTALCTCPTQLMPA